MVLSKKMPAKRREKIEQIAQRQLEQEKRGRLESVLVQKLAMKHGSKSAKPIPKSVITTTVKSFLDEKGVSVLSETDVRKVDALVDLVSERLFEISSSVKRDKTQQQQQQPSSPNSTTTSSSSTTSTSNETKTTTQDQHSQKPKLDPIIANTNPWSLLEAFKAVETEQIQTTEKQKAKTDRIKMIAALNDQIRSKRLVKESHKQIDVAYVTEQTRQLTDWRLSQKKIAEKERQKSLLLKTQRQRQIVALRKFKLREKEEVREWELKDIAHNTLQLEKAARKRRQHRIDERNRLERVRIENIARAELRSQKKNREALEDAKLMYEMKAKLDAEEARKMKLSSNKTFFEGGVAIRQKAAVVRERRCKEMAAAEEKLRVVQERKRKEDEERDLFKTKMLQFKKEEIMESNKGMVAEKRRRELERDRADQAYSVRSCQDRDAFLAEGKTVRKKKVEGKKEYCMLLKRQIEEQKLNQENYLNNMTTVEKSINRTVMKNIEDDPVLQQKILNKIILTTGNRGASAMDHM